MMNVKTMWAWGAGVALLAALPVMAGGPDRRPAIVQPGTPTDCRPGTRGDVPFPFCDPNQRYELADGESYILPGWLAEAAPGKPVFEVNLTRVPHLANRARKASPLFRLMPGPLVDRSLREFHGQEVKVSVVAHSKIVSNADTGEIRPEIFLDLVRVPEVLRTGPIEQE